MGEPTLAEILREPIVRMLMESDGVTDEDILSLAEEVLGSGIEAPAWGVVAARSRGGFSPGMSPA